MERPATPGPVATVVVERKAAAAVPGVEAAPAEQPPLKKSKVAVEVSTEKEIDARGPTSAADVESKEEVEVGVEVLLQTSSDVQRREVEEDTARELQPQMDTPDTALEHSPPKPKPAPVEAESLAPPGLKYVVVMSGNPLACSICFETSTTPTPRAPPRGTCSGRVSTRGSAATARRACGRHPPSAAAAPGANRRLTPARAP